MSLIRKILFTDESPRRVLDLDEQEEAFGPTYGNRRANGRRFRQPWSHQHRDAAVTAPDAGGACCVAGCG